MRGSPNARTNPCSGTGRQVARRGNQQGQQVRCQDCGRTVPLNYDGSLRWHKAEVKR
jgi:hypothetical protein